MRVSRREGNEGLGLRDPLWKGLELGEEILKEGILEEPVSGLGERLRKDLTAAVAIELNLQP